ncbi:MAG: ABC transporter permease, partial [bacterium]|nr:ABC transporter permease [bacterium]
MSLTDVLRFAWLALAGHRLRTGLSLLGMAIGVAAVVMLTALGEGARLYVTGQFTTLGTNLVIVVPGKNETTGTVPGVAGVPNDLTLDDAWAITREVPQVQRVAPIAVATETVSSGERRRQVAVIGTTRDYFRIRQLGLERGDLLPAGEFFRGSPVAILGSETARELFGEQNPVGKVVRVGSWRMRVIGVMASKGLQIGVDLDDLVLVPVATALKMFNRSSLFRIVIEVRSHRDIEAARANIVALITERHGEEDITCVTQDAVVTTFSAILNALTVALAAIAAISLTVAGIGIMNVMLVSVSERTAEVGLLKAIGARRGQIQAVFLAEAALLSTAGG